MEKARLVEIQWDARQQQAQPVSDGKSITVQFNPQSLKVTFANENRGGDQPGGSARQFVGSGTSKLAVELFFDTTGDGSDVRRKTEQVAYFIQAKAQANPNNRRTPPGISFEWGTFIFRGIVDSMDETLDYFSEEGVPLRATISLNISRQEIEFIFGQPGRAGNTPGAAAGAPGTNALTPARPNDSVQRLAGRNGNSSDWKAIAAANGIDDPLRLAAGALLNLNAGATGSAGLSASVNGGISAGGNASLQAGANLSAGAAISAGGAAGFSAGLGGGVGFSAGLGLSASGGISAGAGISASGGISASAGVSASAGITAGAGFGAGVDILEG